MLDTAAESVGAVSVPIDANGRAFRLADLLRAAVNAIEATMDAAMKQAQMATPTITITGPEEVMALLRTIRKSDARPPTLATSAFDVPCALLHDVPSLDAILLAAGPDVT